MNSDLLELRKYLTKQEIDEIEILANGLNSKKRRDHYWNHPNGIIDFCKDVLGFTPHKYQERILKNFVKHRRIAVVAPRGVGKSALATCAIWWLVTCSPDNDVKVITTASVWKQLEVYLWPEIRKWGLRANWSHIGYTIETGKELLVQQIKIANGQRLVFAASPEKPEAIEGAHAGTVCVVIDEAKIVPDGVFDAIEGAFSTKGTNAFVLTISTPGAPIGRFYDIHRGRIGLENWHTEKITLQEALDAGVIDSDHAETMKRLWGEDSPLYKNHFLGEFAESSDWGLIKLSWVQSANELWYKTKQELDNGTRKYEDAKIKIWGLDPADTGMDKTAICALLIFEDVSFFAFLKYYNEEVMKGLYRLKQLGLHTEFDEKGKHKSGDIIAIDGLGIGAGLYQTIRDEKHKVHNVKFSGRAVDRMNKPLKDSTGMNTFQNIRIAAYWALREGLDPDSAAFANIALPPDEDLTRDLIVHEWSESLGVLRMKETKDKLRETLGRSPDGGDSVAIAWWIASKQTRRRKIGVVKL